MKYTRIICLLIVFFLGLSTGFSQTKPKTSTKSTTKNTTTKTKAAPKEINVYVCTDPKDKFYHKYSSCKNLNKCGNQIKNVKSSAELKKYKRKSCLHCFNL